MLEVHPIIFIFIENIVFEEKTSFFPERIKNFDSITSVNYAFQSLYHINDRQYKKRRFVFI